MGQIDPSAESALALSEPALPLAISESLVPVRKSKRAGTVLLSLDGLLQPPLQIKEDLKEGCGGKLWPAGMVLAKYMLRKHKSDLCGKSIVELGAGGGLVGLAVARGCTVDSPIYITDQIPMLSLMQSNVQFNGLSDIVHPAVLDWGSALPETVPSKPAIILAADCVYFEPAFPLLLSTLQSLLSSSNSLCYFCFKKRRRADLRFMKQAKKLFHVVEVKDDPDHEHYSKENIFLYIIEKRGEKVAETGERME
ncbi:hypothetical protein EMCG_04872 [[Emmonsia] crescens]|uniref:Protein-lysine N-methyltransferase EFM6 n=1 Tax=[Emmonsia] crescens TaxID=73230 RepID=A0A0G2IY98_9EURO|nr:hypothetical protein EMCG_04872 [Emmonsia crescens UAMH 3008]